MYCTARKSVRTLLVVLGILLSRQAAQAQKPAPVSPAGSMEQERLKEAAVERQRHMLDDAQRLLVMAQQLKSSVDKSSKDQLSLDVIREAEQIEKLAKQVKERMRQ